MQQTTVWYLDSYMKLSYSFLFSCYHVAILQILSNCYSTVISYYHIRLDIVQIKLVHRTHLFTLNCVLKCFISLRVYAEISSRVFAGPICISEEK